MRRTGVRPAHGREADALIVQLAAASMWLQMRGSHAVDAIVASGWLRDGGDAGRARGAGQAKTRADLVNIW